MEKKNGTDTANDGDEYMGLKFKATTPFRSLDASINGGDEEIWQIGTSRSYSYAPVEFINGVFPILKNH
jgi:hypothetical protein